MRSHHWENVERTRARRQRRTGNHRPGCRNVVLSGHGYTVTCNPKMVCEACQLATKLQDAT